MKNSINRKKKTIILSDDINTMEIQRLLTIGGKVRIPGQNLIEVGNASRTAVDLGLTIMWSDCNYGAGSPISSGSYYSWGELSTKARYRKKDYSNIEMSQLDDAHDIVAASWGSPWRMPTYSELNDLITNCEKEWVDEDLYKGIRFKKNGNSVFFPVTGYMDDQTTKNSSEVWIWSKSQYDKDEAYAMRIYRNGDTIYVSSETRQYKYYGLNIRPVCPSNIPVSSVIVSPQTLDMQTGDNKTIHCYVYPDYASNKNVTWSTATSGIVTISESGGNECVVTAVAAGTVSITAKSQADQTKSDSCTVTVTDAPTPPVAVTEVKVQPVSLNLNVGADSTLTATVKPDNASNKNVHWTSGNENVATVNSSGKVTAVSAGFTVITVKTVDGGFTDTCSVTVTEPSGS